MTAEIAQVNHGSLKGYLDGCRCDPCRLGWNDYMANRRAAARRRLAEAAWVTYAAAHPETRRDDFVAGFLAGRRRTNPPASTTNGERP